MSEAQRVSVQVEAGVADVRLNRPDKMNAIDAGMFSGLVEVGRQLAQDPAVRAVVLSGEGRGFCAGLDMASFQAMGEGASRSRGSTSSLFKGDDESPANTAQRAAFIWQEVPVPVIAAVHGVAYGGGFQIAMGADIRYVAPDARLSIMEIKWGLIPDMAGTQLLRPLLPLDRIKELTWSGRVVSGEEAVELGLATKTSERPREEALELAHEIASKSPDAIRAGKQLLNQSVQVSLREGLELEGKIQRDLIGGANQVEAVRANLERRAPAFHDPK